MMCSRGMREGKMDLTEREEGTERDTRGERTRR